MDFRLKEVISLEQVCFQILMHNLLLLCKTSIFKNVFLINNQFYFSKNQSVVVSAQAVL